MITSGMLALDACRAKGTLLTARLNLEAATECLYFKYSRLSSGVICTVSAECKRRLVVEYKRFKRLKVAFLFNLSGICASFMSLEYNFKNSSKSRDCEWSVSCSLKAKFAYLVKYSLSKSSPCSCLKMRRTRWRTSLLLNEPFLSLSACDVPSAHHN